MVRVVILKRPVGRIENVQFPLVITSLKVKFDRQLRFLAAL
jgi:hypothetical protein